MPLTRNEEAVLVARIQRLHRGETDETHTLAELRDELLAAHHERLVRLCTRIAGNHERGEELAADALLTGWEKIVSGEFRGESAFSTFLYGIAKHKAVRATQKRIEVLLDEDVVFDVQSPERDSLAALTADERERCIRAATMGLDARDQEVVRLRYVDGLPYTSIEALLEIDTDVEKSGVRGILVRCKRGLERELREWLAAHGHGTSFFESA
jgi:RNA polymerase sigma factor (sigma-70 family)